MHSRTIMKEVVDRLGPDLILTEKLPEVGSVSDVQPENPGVIASWIGALRTWIGNIDPISTEERAIRALEKSFSISAAEKSSLVKVEFKSKESAGGPNDRL